MTELTLLELEVLAGAAQGESVEASARRLRKAQGTIKHHRAAVLHKLGATNMTAAVRVAYERGIFGARPTAEQQQITDGQRRAFHKKCSDVDRLRELDDRTTKKLVLTQASLEFGTPIESVNDLDRRQASLVLDLLERILDGADARPGVGERHLIAIGATA